MTMKVTVERYVLTCDCGNPGLAAATARDLRHRAAADVEILVAAPVPDQGEAASGTQLVVMAPDPDALTAAAVVLVAVMVEGAVR